MATVNIAYGTTTAFTVAASLASANYDLTGTVYNLTTTKPLDLELEYVATVAASSTGNKQIVLFLQVSLDGTNFSNPPLSVTDTTHDSSLILLGTIPTNGGASIETVRKTFSLANALGASLPAAVKLVVKNDTGVAMSSCSAQTRELTATVV